MTAAIPSPPPRPRHRYKQLISAVVAASGDWIKISLDEIGGSTNTTKYSLIHQAAYNRRLSFQTTVVDGFMYVRLRNEEDTLG